MSLPHLQKNLKTHTNWTVRIPPKKSISLRDGTVISNLSEIDSANLNIKMKIQPLNTEENANDQDAKSNK